MFFRAAKAYLRMEWIRAAAAVFAILLYVVLMVNNTRTMPMTYETFMAQYGRHLTVEKLAKWVQIPQEELGGSFAEAYPVIREQHFQRFVRNTCGLVLYFAPVVAGVLAALFPCAIFRKRRLGPLLAAGCGRGAVYLFLTVLYFAFFLLLWFAAVPLALSCYRIVPLTAGQQACLRLIRPSVLFSLLFAAAAGHFFAFLLRRPFPAALAAVALWFLVFFLSGQRVPVHTAFVLSLTEWNAAASPGPLVLQGCVTAAAVAAAVVGGWFCFRRTEQE